MPYPNEHAYRLKEPGTFDSKSFRRTAGGTLYGGRVTVPNSISIIWAKLKGRAKPSDPPIVQSLRFLATSWTPTKAKAWIKKNIKQSGKFEPAASSSATEQSENYNPNDDVIWDDEEQYGNGETLDEQEFLVLFTEDDGETAEGEATEEAARKQEEQLLAADDGETAIISDDGETAKKKRS